MIDVSVVIVNWNVKDLLDLCLASLHRGSVAISQFQDDLPLIEVIVVDAASDDDSVAMVQQKYDKVTLNIQKENVGFTRGNNIGLREAGDVICSRLIPIQRLSMM